ncbi:MAG: hypothetical protein NTZ20_05130 [Candidatus Levybacteria bacterium]|nr:hypothetical protein [Candidatus Levybacteria bacterium]
MEIRTNNVPRYTINWHELTLKEQAEFDYLDSDDKRHETQFVRYRGWVYDTSEFMGTDSGSPFSGWHGYHSDSFFSAVLIRYVDNGTDSVIMGTAYS